MFVVYARTCGYVIGVFKIHPVAVVTKLISYHVGFSFFLRYWEDRSACIEPLFKQVQQSGFTACVKVLEMAETGPLNGPSGLRSVVARLRKQHVEALWNYKYLRVLRVPFTKLIGGSIREVMCCTTATVKTLRSAWGTSRFYSSAERMQPLLERIHVALCLRASAAADPARLLRGLVVSPEGAAMTDLGLHDVVIFEPGFLDRLAEERDKARDKSKGGRRGGGGGGGGGRGDGEEEEDDAALYDIEGAVESPQELAREALEQLVADSKDAQSSLTRWCTGVWQSVNVVENLDVSRHGGHGAAGEGKEAKEGKSRDTTSSWEVAGVDRDIIVGPAENIAVRCGEIQQLVSLLMEAVERVNATGGMCVGGQRNSLYDVYAAGGAGGEPASSGRSELSEPPSSGGKEGDAYDPAGGQEGGREGGQEGSPGFYHGRRVKDKDSRDSVSSEPSELGRGGGGGNALTAQSIVDVAHRLCKMVGARAFPRCVCLASSPDDACVSCSHPTCTV
jgi:hypothetical protein